MKALLNLLQRWFRPEQRAMQTELPLAILKWPDCPVCQALPGHLMCARCYGHLTRN